MPAPPTSPKKQPLMLGYQYRMYPTEEQILFIEESFSAVRRVYNELLADNLAKYEAHTKDTSNPKPKTSPKELSRKLTELKKVPEYDWLYQYSAVALQQSTRNLSTAFTNFYKRVKEGKGPVGFPKFHSVKDEQSITLVGDTFSVEDGYLKIIKLPTPIRLVWSRDLPSEPSSITITRNRADEYHVSFKVVAPKRHTKGIKVSGSDLGLTTTATIYDGQEVIKIENPRHYVKSECKLGKLNRRLSHKTKGSRNWHKAKRKLAKHHRHIANQRKDFQHKLSTQLVKENRVLVIENLNTKGMSANHKLAKHIMDASFASFKSKLAYKTLCSTGTTLLVADMYYPSTQLCSTCHTRPNPKIKLGVTSWTCSTCGTTHDRDGNSGRNLRQLGMEKIAKGMPAPGTVVICEPYHQVAQV